MLPSYSLTREAILNDPEAVEAMAQAGLFDKQGGEKTIAVSEATPVIDALYDILVELRINNHIQRQGKGRVQPPPKTDIPLVEEAKRKARQSDYEALKNFFGG